MTGGLLLAAVPLLGNAATVMFTFYPPMKAHWASYVGLTVVVAATWLVTLNLTLTYRAWRARHPEKRISLLYFLDLVLTLVASRTPAPEPPEFAEAISGPEHAPAFLDRWRPWLVLAAAALIVVAYGPTLLRLVLTTLLTTPGLRVWCVALDCDRPLPGAPLLVAVARHARPAGRTDSTGHEARWMTRSATLPSMARSTPPSPREPTTIRSVLGRAALTISRWGAPDRSSTRTASPEALASAAHCSSCFSAHARAEA
jgi:hypothetical protein